MTTLANTAAQTAGCDTARNPSQRPRSLFAASHTLDGPADERPRFLSEADCRRIAQRLGQLAKGGGYTAIHLVSIWRGNLRWARNQISTTGEVCDNYIIVRRNINGAYADVKINETTDTALVAAARQAERLAMLSAERPFSDLMARFPLEPYENPSLFSEATYQLDAQRRADAAITLMRAASEAKMLSAGYIEVVARSMGTFDTLGRALYYPYTQAQCSMTVRDPKGTGSGWAGANHHDWAKIDPDKLATLALDKCLKSQNPVRVEPGRYTAILEPQAVADFVGCLFAAPDLSAQTMDQTVNLLANPGGPFNVDREIPRMLENPGQTLLGEKIVDERITIGVDPMDPEIGIPPYFLSNSLGQYDPFLQPVYHKTTWIDRGVLTKLAYNREEAIAKYTRNTGIPNSGSFRMSGGGTSIDEMIASTKRGLLVTRFDRLWYLDFPSQLFRGYTRDGLWLIENGKISKSVKNMVFTESILFALNNVDQLGVPQRAFRIGYGGTGLISHPQPAVVPPLKIKDFSFTALTDAV